MDWVAAVAIVLGIYLLGKKSPYGFLWIVVGGGIGAVLQVLTDPPLWGLAAQSALGAVMNLWGYWQWTRKKA